MRGKIFPSKLEIGDEDADIKDKPDCIDDRLHADRRLKSVIGVEQLLGEVQSKSVKRNCVRAVFETQANAIDINDGPTDSADKREYYFDRFEANHPRAQKSRAA